MIQIICASCIVLAGFGDEPFSPGRSRLGINLSGPADWNTEQPFVDVFRLARAWISQEQGKGWGRGPALELDARGWVKSLAPGCSAETLMCTIEGGHYPAGRYVCLYEGEGAIEFSNAGRVVSRAPGRIVCEVAPERGAIFLRLAATGHLVARAAVRRAGRSVGFVEVEIEDAGGAVVATGRACYAIRPDIPQT